MGENLLGAIGSFTDHLADAAAAAAELQEPSSSPSREDKEASERGTDAVSSRAVYFDILGWTMLSYPDSAAAVLHHLPGLIALGLPLLLLSSLSTSFVPPPSRSGKFDGGRRKDSNAAARSGSMVEAYRVYFGAAMRTLASVLLAVAMPAALGALRVVVSGRPMVW